MGLAVARAAVAAGHHVTLLAGPGVRVDELPDGCQVARFTSVADLQAALAERFAACDALVMAAAPGDFTPRATLPGKVHRRDGPLTVELIPTADILAGIGAGKRADQLIIAFAVEEGSPAEIEAAASRKLAVKNADYIVVNTPAAMAATVSRAAILSPRGIVLPWAQRPKEALAAEIVKLLRPAP
jgi:phosphopantothenoylcysteine decarboxylase/phosphopantothenate--cysteine ligase